jgi:ribonucleoside-diphosphate reductase alpha chain
MFKTVLKRNGQAVPFNSEKIVKAIYKASVAVGEENWDLAETLAKEVVKRVAETKKGAIPEVEEIQDMVERVLIDTGHAKMAKSYILYREHRADIRHQKEQILNKEEIDEVDKKFDLNALRVLASRYLVKDEEGNILESPKELFSRVATHITIASLFYDAKIFQKRPTGTQHRAEEVDCKKLDGKLAIGQYKLNEFHVDALHRLYARFAENRQIKVSWGELLDLFKQGYFDKYAAELEGYYGLMVGRKFLPNTPAIANFGNHLGMGSACFTLAVNDSIDDIMDTLKSAAVIFKSGGGVGYNFSHLRPEGDFVKTTGGTASGPISFMSMFDNMTEVIKQGGIRRGANMGILNSNHPDIEKFIKAKEGNKALRNFNISVMLMPEFWKALKEKKPYQLLNPRSGKVVKEVDPESLFDLIAYQAWESAEPGALFFDNINEHNPFLKAMGPIESTNPCGEVVLYPFESCNLGSINVWAYAEKNGGKKAVFNWDRLATDIQTSMRLLDNVIDVNKYPMKEIEDMTLSTRKIGFGMMGLGDLLYELEIPYDSKEGFAFMDELMEFLNYQTKLASVDLAKERGRMPMFDKTAYKDGKMPFSAFKDKASWKQDWKGLVKKMEQHGIRNGFTTVLAPTGSISMIAGCSSGIEPVFSLVFEKSITIGSFFYVDPVFEDRMQREGLMDDALLKDVSSTSGSVQNISYMPPKVKKVFVTSMDIAPKDHVKVLGLLQRWTDSSISKTNNLPAMATVEDIKEIYLLAHDLGCKGVTVYRDKSLTLQVMNAGTRKGDKEREKEKSEMVALKDEKAKGMAIYHKAGAPANAAELGLSPASSPLNTEDFNGSIKELTHCPSCKTKLVRQEGCRKCPNCGWGLCS